MELERSAASVSGVVGGAVGDESVEDQASARLERGRNGLILPKNLRIANLPVTTVEVGNRTLAMAAGEEVHTAVLRIGVVEGDPDSDYVGSFGQVEVGVVLMPGDRKSVV